MAEGKEDETDPFFEIFYPYTASNVKRIRGTDVKFSYYTSAATALSIIDKEEVWLRNARLMNDFSEIDHGQTCLHAAWSDLDVSGNLKNLLNSISPSACAELEARFDSWHNQRHFESYIISISEHGNDHINEDRYGRLSMWRAYGGKCNVAFVMNKEAFLTESDVLGVWGCPVLYKDSDGFKEHFKEYARGVESNWDRLKDISLEQLLWHLFCSFHFFALSTKHPGFSEEKEWRLFLSPDLWPSHKLIRDTRIIDDVPQTIYRLPLKNYPDDGLVGATLPELIDKIIIGPTEYPWTVKQAIVAALESKGVQNASAKVMISDIPLRR